MAAALAQTQQKNEDVGVVFTDSACFEIFVEYDLGLAFQGLVVFKLVFVKDNVLDFFGLWRKRDDGLAINHGFLRTSKKNSLDDRL